MEIAVRWYEFHGHGERCYTIESWRNCDAANGDLDHCGGLALTISKAGQKSSNVF